MKRFLPFVTAQKDKTKTITNYDLERMQKSYCIRPGKVNKY